jgi:hypothetical protein
MQENNKPGDKTETTNNVRNKTEALKALREIQRAFAKSKVTEAELQAEGKRVREKITSEKKFKSRK